MDAEPQRPKGQDTTLSTLNLAIDALNFSKDVSGIEPAKIAFGTVSVLLTMIKVRSFLSLRRRARISISRLSRTR